MPGYSQARLLLHRLFRHRFDRSFQEDYLIQFELHNNSQSLNRRMISTGPQDQNEAILPFSLRAVSPAKILTSKAEGSSSGCISGNLTMA